jgi:hypothetical protein
MSVVRADPTRSSISRRLTSANKCNRCSLNFSIRVQLVTSYFLDSIRILFIFKTDLFTTLSGFLACSSVQEMCYCYSSIQSCQKYARVYYASVRAEKNRREVPTQTAILKIVSGCLRKLPQQKCYRKANFSIDGQFGLC